MNTPPELAHELHRTRHTALADGSHAARAAAATRWQHRAERLARRAQRASRRAERARLMLPVSHVHV